MAHTCSAALVRCMDFRLEPAISEYLKSEGLTGDTDVISAAGASKDIAQLKEGYVEGQVDLSHKLHEIETVVLMNHTDCGGYGGRPAFESDEAEWAKHVEDLNAAKAKLIAKYPELDVRLTIAHITDAGVEIKNV